MVDQSEDADLIDDANGQLGVHISRASLRGEGVLESTELKNLFQRGFYISKIVWLATRNSDIDSDLYEFEAQFSEPETCTRFSYLPRGYYGYVGPKEYAVSRTQCAVEEDRDLSKRIETAARNSLPSAVFGKTTKPLVTGKKRSASVKAKIEDNQSLSAGPEADHDQV